MKKTLVLILTILIILPVDSEARRRRGRQKTKEGTGQQGYIIFEMIKAEKKDPFPIDLRYPLFKGTHHYQHDKINSLLQQKIDKQWICSQTQSGSDKEQKFSLNTKILTFHPSIISMKVTLDYNCGDKNKGSREVGINVDPKTGQEIPPEMFVDKNEFSSLQDSYLERALDSSSEECKTYFKNNKSNLNQFEFLLAKDQISLKATLDKEKIDCETFVDYSFDEFSEFRPAKFIQSLMSKSQSH